MRVSIRVAVDQDEVGKTTVCETNVWEICNGPDEYYDWNYEDRWGRQTRKEFLRIYAASKQQKSDGSRGGDPHVFWREARISFAPEEIPRLIEGLTRAGYLTSNMVTALEEARDKIDSVLRELRPENG